MAFGEFEVENELAKEALKEIADLITPLLPPQFGFSLLIFPYQKSGQMFYISSANREDMFRAMREFMSKYEVRQ